MAPSTKTFLDMMCQFYQKTILIKNRFPSFSQEIVAPNIKNLVVLSGKKKN